MLVQRWQAPILPTQAQMLEILEQQGYDSVIESFDSKTRINDHRHPLDEVRFVLSGELLVNIAGNQLLLRPGDQIMIPANTRHSYTNNYTETCVSICAQKPF